MTDLLQTERLLLRPLAAGDVAALVEVAGERRIADTTISVPHPFTADHARAMIDKAAREAAQDESRSFAVVLSEQPQELIGYAALRDIDREHLQSELSFWIGVDHEGRGLVTEAGRRLIVHGFEDLGLNRICAFHMLRNGGSGRVLAKLGFRQEGVLRQRVRKWGVFEDVAVWGVIRGD